MGINAWLAMEERESVDETSEPSPLVRHFIRNVRLETE